MHLYRKCLWLVLTAVLLTALGCGGGGGSGRPALPAPADTGGGEPDEPAVPAPADIDYSRINTNATDLLDIWNDPAPLSRALGLAPAAETAARERQLRALLIGRGAAGESMTRFRNIDPADLEILGERDGFTYARWKGGPAGGLDIDFHWEFAPGFTAHERAMVERAGKEWAYRLDDTIDGTFTVEGRHLTDHSGGTVPDDLHSKDLTIIMHTSGAYLSSGGTWLEEVTEKAYKPRIGVLYIVDVDRGHGDAWFRYTAAHEIGHNLGFTAYLSERAPPAILDYFDFDDGTFNGPASVRANGGAPVPFQWLNAQHRPVPPGTPDAKIDYGHPAPCPAILSYCGDPVTTPHELDFALLADIGFSVRPASVRDDPETYGYAAWGEWAAWGVGAARLLRDTEDVLLASADAFGIKPAMTLEGNAALTGAVSWSGSLLGVDLAPAAAFAPVTGSAAVTVDLATLDGHAAFENLRVGVRGGDAPFRRSSLSYAISVEGNGFADAAGHVEGGFFGPAHQEMAGTLDDRTPGVELLAGFGGKR